MLISPTEYEAYGIDPADKTAVHEFAAIEATIRAVTHNNFQVRGARFEAESKGGALLGASPYINPGDTVQITCSDVNDGVYVVQSSFRGCTKLDCELLDAPFNRVTLVRYPPDVKAGAVRMLEYDRAAPKDKARVASETISRHSVTYRNATPADSIAGYPFDVAAFLKPHMRAWF